MAFYLYVTSSGEVIRETTNSDFGTVQAGHLVVELAKTSLPRPWLYNGTSIITPTSAQIAAFPAARTIADVEQIRLNSNDIVDLTASDLGQLIRALALVMMDEFNLLRNLHSLSPRTGNQLKNAIKNKINAGQAD